MRYHAAVEVTIKAKIMTAIFRRTDLLDGTMRLLERFRSLQWHYQQ
jgi:hypothetical protein